MSGTDAREARALLLAVALLLHGGGCERVGAPLVAYEEPEELPKIPAVRCTEPPECEGGLPPDVPVTALPVSPFHRASCAPPEEGDATTRCGELLIEDDQSAIPLAGVNWALMNVRVASQRPLLVELDGATLQQTYVALSGPVTLRISNTQGFSDVRVASEPSEFGQPRLELRYVAGERLSAGDGEHAFDGTLALVRANLARAQLIASSVSLESVALDGGLVSAAQLNAADTEFYGVGLTIDSGVLAACLLRESVVHECGALTLLAGKLRHSWLPGCGVGPLRVYEVDVVGGRFDGEIESDRSNWEGVLFGSREPTDLLMFDGAVHSVNFCGESRARFADSASARCTRCDGWSAEGAVCMDAKFPSMFDANFCEFLREVPVCEQPLPPRERPLPLPTH